MSLEKKSLVDLRGIAQSLGVMPNWKDDKAKLIGKIRASAEKQYTPPSKAIVITTPVQATGQALTQKQVTDALAGFHDLGLHVSFPDKDTWSLYCNKKEDSGTMYQSLWSVISCAKELVKP